MPTLLRDLRGALRMLRIDPGFAAVAMLAFALGIGANSAIFSVVNSILLRPMAYADPERLVVLEHGGPSPVAPATFLDWEREATSFEQMAAAQSWGGSMRTPERPEPIVGLRVSANMFAMLGVPPIKGRTFTHDEDQDGAAPVVVIGYSLWQRSFGGANDIVGRQVVIDGAGYTVAGVMPPSFQFAPFWVTRAEIWTPFVFGDRKTDRNGKSIRVFGRLKRGVTVQQAQAEMTGIMGRLAKLYPESSARETVALTPLRDRVVGGIRLMLWVLSGTVGFVLLIACANVANLMLARAGGRRREVAVRLALGASRWQLARQAITESAVLAMLGGLAGLAIAYAGVYALNNLLPPGTLPRQKEIGVDSGVLVFSGTLSLLTGILAGLLPAWHSSRGDVNETLKEGGRSGSSGRRGHRTRSLLVVSEIALAFVLLVGAGLMIRSFANLISQDAGFDPSNLLTLEVSVSGTREAAPERRAIFYRDVLDRIAAIPGVQSASAVNHAPITGDVWGTQFRVEGREQPRPGEWPNAVYRVALPGYFATMRAPLLHGRDFTTADTLNSPLVVIVNESLARKEWPNQDAVGQRIASGRDGPYYTVAGVVHDIKQSDWQANPKEEIYFPLLQSPEYLSSNAAHYQFLSLVLRANGDPSEKSASVRRAIESIDRDVLVSGMIGMERAVANNTWRQRLSLLLLGAIAVVAMVLAITGVYGVISQAVSQRTHEIGIRMAVGATGAEVLVQSILRGLAPISIGLLAGAALAILLTRLMRSMLFGVTATDPLTFGTVTAVMLAAGLFAAFWPALRAARVDPIAALRCD